MKKIKFLMVFGICLVFCFLLTAGVLGQENIPTITLPISNLLEVRKDLIREEGNAFPGGWSEYYVDYKIKINQSFYGEEASPFDTVIVVPFTLETWWVEALMSQDQNFESNGYADDYFAYFYNEYPCELLFQIVLISNSLDLLKRENLRFVYQDSTGTRSDGIIDRYEPDETKKTIYSARIWLSVKLYHLLTTDEKINLIKDKYQKNIRTLDEKLKIIQALMSITWFSLHILNKNTAGRVDMRWNFRKD